MQLEFDFTWYRFCELVDKENGEVVGATVIDCICVDGVYYPAFEAMEEFEDTPFVPRCAA